MIQDTTLIAEVVGTQIAAEDFVSADAKALYGTVVELYYGDQAVEPLTVAERAKSALARTWRIGEQHVPQKLLERLSDRDYGTSTLEHAGIVRQLSEHRRLLTVAERAKVLIGEGKTPEEVASMMSAEALAVTSGAQARAELHDWMGTGREFIQHLRRLRLARDRGIEMAVYTGLSFLDDFTKGIAPTELCFLGGAPGAGKSIIGWKAAEGFALRQMAKQEEHRIGTLLCSMEMGLVPSATRLAQSISGVDGMALREGNITNPEYQKILREWKARDGLPIYFNYASNFRLSQLRALIVEAIRRYNVGFIVLDHFRQIDPDKPIRDANDRDEVKVRFLKESLCKDLNVAILCLAHTVKIGRGEDMNAKPRLSDLRGSGQIAANADFVALMHRPNKDITEEEEIAGVDRAEAELVWAKARHTTDGTAKFGINPATMTVWSR